jgi:hypothetical protein
MKAKPTPAGLLWMSGVVFGIVFSWSPGQSQNKTKKSPSSNPPPVVISTHGALAFQNPLPTELDAAPSPTAELHKSEFELYLLKRERHKLEKAVHEMEKRLQRHRLPARPLRRPST